ncbi:hypothetical protein LSAT2_009320 [Lamellibrachia satsuma]|nr:hypothetical protein LSAT2_009320 [Lamellibrachia satsuma]
MIFRLAYHLWGAMAYRRCSVFPPGHTQLFSFTAPVRDEKFAILVHKLVRHFPDDVLQYILFTENDI